MDIQKSRQLCNDVVCLRWDRLLTFVNNRNLAVGFVTPREGAALPTREDGALAFHVLVLNPKDGSLQRNGAWPTENWGENAIFATAGDNLLVRTSGQLRLLSEGLEQRQLRQLPKMRTWLVSDVSILLSPSGRLLWIGDGRDLEDRAGNERSDPSGELIAADSLRTIKVFSVASGSELPVTISDRLLARAGQQFPQDGSKDGLQVAEMGGPWQTIRRLETGCGNPPPVFITETLLVTGKADSRRRCNRLVVLESNGDIVYEEGYSRREQMEWPGPRPSRGGKRFVLHVSEYRGGSRVFDISPRTSQVRVLVYDVTRMGKVFEVKLAAPFPRFILDYAISPDGTQLAIMADDKVAIYDLPPVQALRDGN